MEPIGLVRPRLKSLYEITIRMLTLVSRLAVAISLSVISPRPAPSDQATPWYSNALVGMEVGPTGAQFGSDPSDVGYAARFNGRDVVRSCKAAGCGYVVIWARDGEYAYYDSKLQPKAPGLGTRDVLREAVDEGKRLRIPIIAYCVLQSPSQTLREHPDWAIRDSLGHTIPGRICFNSPYLAYMKAMLSEMLAYGIAGFHLDMVDQGFGPPYGCWCDSCKNLFFGRYGKPMPKGATWDEDWDRMLDFRYDSSARFEKELAAHVRSTNKRASVDFNYHGNPPFSFELGQRPVQHAGNGDFVTGETGVWGFSALTVGLNAEFYRAAAPNQRVQVAMQRGVRMYHDQTTRPLADIRWELLTLLSHGAFVTMVDKTAYEGRLDPEAYRRIRMAFADAESKRAQFTGKPLAEVGIWFSSRTRDWFARETPSRYFQSFLGAHKALAYSHVPLRVVLDENATAESLRDLPVLLVPNAAIIQAKDADLFRKYVTRGGHLIITGQTGLFDRFGHPQDRSSIEDLIGAKYVRTLDSIDNHVRLPSGPRSSAIRGAIPPDWSFLVKGAGVVYAPTTGTSFGRLLIPQRTVRQKLGKEGTDWPMSAGEPAGPAVLVNWVGKGSVVTLACSPDSAVGSDHYIVEDRLLLANAVHALNPNPRIRIDAPANVDAVVTDDPRSRTLRVHLLCYSAPPQTMPAQNRPYVLPALMEEPPIFRASLTLRDPIRSMSRFNASTVVHRSGKRIDLLVQDVHEAVEIRY